MNNIVLHCLDLKEKRHQRCNLRHCVLLTAQKRTGIKSPFSLLLSCDIKPLGVIKEHFCTLYLLKTHPVCKVLLPQRSRSASLNSELVANCLFQISEHLLMRKCICDITTFA